MNLRPLLGSLGLAAVLGLTAASAGAQTPPPAKYNYREKSQANVAKIGMQSSKLIEKLQADNNGYGGHRVAAINALQTAQTELDAAAAYAAAHGYQAPVENPKQHTPNPNRTRAKSDWSIEKGQMAVQRWIMHLQNDSRDFGGHRSAAITSLQQAETELGAATQYATEHGH